MAKNKNESAILRYDILVLKRRGVTRDLPSGTESLQWVTNTVTLIYGEHDAVVVDTFATIDQNQQLVDWITKSGKNLTTIYITHAHGDHSFGIKILLDRFPNARAVAALAVVKAMQTQIDPNYIKNFWNKLFPDQIPKTLIVPEALESNEFELEGHELVVLDNGFTDTEYSTSLYVPSIGLVVAGDAVYNGIHPYMPETTEQSRLNWIAALDRIEGLKPLAVVAGHKNPAIDDNPQHVEATRKYIHDFNRLNHQTTTVRELYDKMLTLYPDRANPGSLWSSARAVKQ
jgi:glyoxylase-like metal-dependent hydrolase (beta-lactamase superfamily II)